MANDMEVVKSQMMALDKLSTQGAALATTAISTLAQSIELIDLSIRIEQCLTQEIVARLMAVKGKEHGWQTDESDGRAPMSMEQVKDGWVSALVKGALPVNSEVLLIGSSSGKIKAYLQKNHFKRRLRQLENFSNLVIRPGKMEVKPGGMFIEMTATCVYKGKLITIDRTGTSAIPVKVNNNQGADASLGKAESKILRQLYNQLTGSDIGEDGDEMDTMVINATVVDDSKPSAPAANGTEASKTVTAPPPTKTDEVKAAMRRGRPKKETDAAPAQDPAASATPASTEAPKTETKVVGHVRSSQTEPFQPVTREVTVQATNVSETKPAAAAVTANTEVKPPPAEPMPEMTPFMVTQFGLTDEGDIDVVEVDNMFRDAYAKDAEGKPLVRIKLLSKSATEYIFYEIDRAAQVKMWWQDAQRVDLKYAKGRNGEYAVVYASPHKESF